MSKNFDFKGRLAGNNFGQQMNTQAASVVSTLAGRTAKDSGWSKKFQVLDIPLTKLHEYPEQKVFSMDEAELEQLTENVRSSGILQPLIVRVHPTIPGDFEIIAGHRRREAARRAGMETVPCQVYMGMTDAEAKTVFYATNMSAALNTATRKVKSSFTNEIFRGDLEYLKEEKSKRRDKLNEQLRKLVSSEYLVDREITDALKDLGKDLRETPGKHTYKFLPPQLKAEVDSVLEKIMQRDPILRSMYEEYLDSQKELALTYASYEETLDKKFAEIENSFFHPYCDFEERRAGRAEVTRHNIIIHAAERYVRPTVQRKTASHAPQKKSTTAMTSAGNAAVLSQAGKPPNAPAVQEKTASHSEPENATPDEKVDGSDYQEKSPTYAVQNMLFRLAKTLNSDQQQTQRMNRAAHVANGLTGEKQNVRKLKTGLSDERNLSTIDL